MEATGNTSGISATARKMGLPMTFCIWLETFIRITLDSLKILLNYLCIYTEIGQYLQNYLHPL